MADKDLKSLTIDGVTCRNVFTNTNIGKIFRTAETASIPGNPNVPTNIASVTIAEPGAYLVSCTVRFQPPSTTGSVGRGVLTHYAGQRGAQYGQASSATDALPDMSDRQVSQTMIFEEADVPVVVSTGVGSSKACSVVAETRIMRLAKYPDVVGGVVRLFENLICYRPLNFGKAVA